MVDDTPPIADVCEAWGYLAGARAMAPARTRRVAALREIVEIWRDYRRDAGAGEVGSAHVPREGAFALIEDERRAPMLQWLADNASGDLGAAANDTVRMIGAARRFASPELELLEIAREALPSPSRGFDESGLIGFAALLRRHPVFAEASGGLATVPGLPVRHRFYQPAAAGGCWAANLALLTLPGGNGPIIGGILSRAMFRLDLEEDAHRAALLGSAMERFQRSRRCLFEVHQLLEEGDRCLASRSKASRTTQAWELVVAFGTVTRTQVARSLALSRAGSDLIASQLEEAGLVSLGANGRIDRVLDRRGGRSFVAPTKESDDAVRSVDAALADLDRLLSKAGKNDQRG